VDETRLRSELALKMAQSDAESRVDLPPLISGIDDRIDDSNCPLNDSSSSEMIGLILPISLSCK
jgi:hypothetical protein